MKIKESAVCECAMDPSIQIWVGPIRPVPAMLTPPRNADDGMMKPEGGLWTSSYNGDPESLSAWVEWCRREDYWTCSDPQAWALKPSETATVYTIDSTQDLLGLPTRSPYGLSMAYLDFQQMFYERDYDGIRLTKKGQQETRFSSDVDVELYGWDCESTVWSRWMFEDVRYIGPVDK